VNAISFVVYGSAVPAGSKTVGFGKGGQHFVRDSSGKRGREWRRNVAQVAGEAMDGHKLLEGPLVLTLHFYAPRPRSHFGAKGLKPSAPVRPTARPDTTKLTRGVEDALKGIVFRDDAQVVDQHAHKHYGEPARCEVVVERLEEATESLYEVLGEIATDLHGE